MTGHRIRNYLRLLIVLLAVFIPAAPLSSTPLTLAAASVPAIDARIEIVWPHDAQGNPARNGTFVNVEVYLFERGTLNPVACTFANNVILRWSRNHFTSAVVDATLSPAHDLPDQAGSAIGHRITRTVDGKTFPAWEFNDVPVAQPLEDTGVKAVFNETYFFVEVEGADARTNVWTHALQGMTALPGNIFPPNKGGMETVPPVIDALITIVWPHNGQG